MLTVFIELIAELLLHDVRRRLSGARVTVWLIEADIAAMRRQDWGN